MPEHAVGQLSAIPVGKGCAVEIGGEAIAVFHMPEGQVRAVSAACTHKGGPLAQGRVAGSLVICPLHLQTFDLNTGRSTCGQPDLTVYPARVDESGTVQISVAG
jgi:nitrite reductase (NADH) small subunit